MDTQQPQTKIDWQKFKITRIARVNGCKAETPSGVVRFINKRRNAMVISRMLNRGPVRQLTGISDEHVQIKRYITHEFYDSRLEAAARKDFLMRHPKKRVVHTIWPAADGYRHFECGTSREQNGKYWKDVNWIRYHSAIDIFDSGRAIVIRCTGRNKMPKRLELRRDGFSFRKPFAAYDYRIYAIQLHWLDCDPQNGLIANLDADRLWDDDAQKNIDQLCADAIGGAK